MRLAIGVYTIVIRKPTPRVYKITFRENITVVGGITAVATDR